MADTTLSAGDLLISLRVINVLSTYPSTPRDTTLDRTVNAEEFPLVDVVITIEGDYFNKAFDAGDLEIVLSNEGDAIEGQVISLDPLEILVSLTSLGTALENASKGWVAWSKIGYLDFTIDQTNVAGKRPMTWKGGVLDILKLGSSVVVYGEGGVSIMSPVETKWGLQDVHRFGIISKGAVAGNNSEHYFIDARNKLMMLSAEGLKVLDYSEYLSVLTNPIIRLDDETGILYICDGTYGFVYSIQSQSFGSGPANLTGIGSQGGTLYVVGDGEIEIPSLYICTDIYDLGSRKPKTINTVEVGTNLTTALQVMIESRAHNNREFLKSKWALVNPSGIAHLPCYGIEFKFHLRSYTYEYLELDYLKVHGVIHGYHGLDAIEQRGL